MEIDIRMVNELETGYQKDQEYNCFDLNLFLKIICWGKYIKY